ncbi:23S rRNA (adenine(2030)-N(6))-methyltransferase RlmJ [Rhodomicrobium sp. Az07]|uniref:23S rRNA (adenine(2030)-N(6))-methyltransferase RlmJ n=1 Tax=Rhodomicrobium sp. Az07 TaxID=2839034 RepID=UPI001BE6786E|nr:23S rRNA (adenine(2030)-N(6))-methyltransferase RlmJ [Rhodomicrobium sp. Az07]MBT3071827.1 23S rRNA (adenine(2030)-N(6))-methyltransferase RlmJ [Rhodomicrobium sp. Az07]
MNYRHAFHAGNFADVIKHAVLAFCVDYLLRKENPLCLVDAHGGAGLYDLRSEEAEKTGEWARGVGALMQAAPGAAEGAAAALEPYLRLVREDAAEGFYPGSPLLLARRLRPQDRLIANELHESTRDALRGTLAEFPGARVTGVDAYECIRAAIPPKERRGLVLIDPPFEEKDEFETLIRQMREWKKRWATGVYLLWYPIKATSPTGSLKAEAAALGLPRTWCVETLIYPRGRALSLNGCGLILFNAPYTVPEAVETALPALADAMRLHETHTAWLVPGA